MIQVGNLALKKVEGEKNHQVLLLIHNFGGFKVNVAHSNLFAFLYAMENISVYGFACIIRVMVSKCGFWCHYSYMEKN